VFNLTRTPLPPFAGEVEARSDEGEGRTARTTLTVDPLRDSTAPLAALVRFTAQAREQRER